MNRRNEWLRNRNQKPVVKKQKHISPPHTQTQTSDRFRDCFILSCGYFLSRKGAMHRGVTEIPGKRSFAWLLLAGKASCQAFRVWIRNIVKLQDSVGFHVFLYKKPTLYSRHVLMKQLCPVS